MKHPPSTVAALLLLFLSAQLIGLFVLNSANLEEDPFPGIERPDVAPSQSYIFIGIAIIIGTALLLLIMKFRKFGLWKLWYFLSVFATLSVALNVFFPAILAGAAAFFAALWKVLRPNFIVHNLTELFIYSGLAVIFVPIMNISSAAILLLLISAYDMYAVWKSGHMVKMAKFQSSSRLFAGLAIPKSFSHMPKTVAAVPVKNASTGDANVAILGGGDIGFPLIFAGVIMSQFGFAKALVIPAFAFLALAFLFAISKKGKFYPAMPFVSAGCFIGYGVISLLA